METIKIQGTEDTPKIILDADNKVLEISGRSLPEDVTAFYEPVLNWLNEYSENPNDKTVFNFKLTYFNTASSKLLLDILMKLEEKPHIVIFIHKSTIIELSVISILD